MRSLRTGHGRRPIEGLRPGLTSSDVRRRRPLLRLLPVLLAAVLLLVAPGPAAAERPRPTADPSAPTPTAPPVGLPPQGSAPDGSTVGGGELGTRGVVVAGGAPRLPGGITAVSWLVADAGTGAVLAARDPHGRYYPASTLKTLTLLTLVPLLDPHQVVVGTADDERIEGSRVGLVAGGRYSVQLLFLALVLQSGNDAANALARAFGGVDQTVEAMNVTAEQIGAYDTVAGTPSGLDVAGQSTSAYDLALIFRQLIENPRTATILRTPTAQLPPVPGRSAGYQIQSQNPLLRTYPGDLGGKTGFTDAARHTFVTAASRGGRTLVVSVMNTENVPLRATDQAVRLLDWGFAVPPGARRVGTLVRPSDLTASPTTAPGTPPRAVVATGPDAAAPTRTGSAVPVPALLALAGVLVVAAAGGTAMLTGRRRARRAVAAAGPGTPTEAQPGSGRPEPPPAG
jgi:serine-type D-Ala-D-Ala carboxypeptidase (penicillin-binding protein 5/6)